MIQLSEVGEEPPSEKFYKKPDSSKENAVRDFANSVPLRRFMKAIFNVRMTYVIEFIVKYIT